MELFARDECIQEDARKHPGYTASPSGARQLETDGTWTAVFAELHSAVTTVILSIAAQFPALQVAPLRCAGYKIQHYKQHEGHFKRHFDALGPGGWDRQLALIVYLNSVADGGETRFHRQNLKIRPVPGDALFFPTLWTHLHCGEIPRSED